MDEAQKLQLFGELILAVYAAFILITTCGSKRKHKLGRSERMKADYIRERWLNGIYPIDTSLISDEKLLSLHGKALNKAQVSDDVNRFEDEEAWEEYTLEMEHLLISNKGKYIDGSKTRNR